MGVKMPRMGESTPLGRLFKARRVPLGWKRVVRETDIDERSIRYYEAGRAPPIDKALILARFYGIPLEQLAAVVLGEPYVPRVASLEPAVPSAGVSDAVVDAVRVLPARERERRQSAPAPKPRHRVRRSREE